MRVRIFLSVLLLSCFVCFSANKSKRKLKLKEQSSQVDDTLIRFIHNYGKDSLIKMLDNKSKQASAYVNNHLYLINEPLTSIQLQLICRHFNIQGMNFQNLTALSGSVKYLIVRLYDEKMGDFDNMISNIKQFKKNKPDYNRDSLFNIYFDTIHARMMWAGACEYINFTANDLDFLYNKTLTYPLDFQADMFWVFTEIDKNCRDSTNQSLKYKNNFFKLLKNSIDFPGSTGSGNTVQTVVSDMFLPVKLAAYGFYSKNLNIHNGKTITRIIDSQKTEGSWSIIDSTPYPRAVEATVYGLWFLNELKEQVKNLVVSPKK